MLTEAESRRYEACKLLEGFRERFDEEDRICRPDVGPFQELIFMRRRKRGLQVWKHGKLAYRRKGLDSEEVRLADGGRQSLHIVGKVSIWKK